MRSWFFVLIFTPLALVLAAQEPNHSQYSIDLKTIGYPQPPCDYMWPEDSFTKNHIEFLDSERMLVNFPFDNTWCDKERRHLPSKFRSVVIDLSGKILHSFDWQRGEDIQAGPEGHILFTTGKEVRILDADFSLLQSIPDPRLELQPMGSVLVDPARKGFVIQNGHVAYFSGTPAKQTQDASQCNVIVVEGGFVCWDSTRPDHFTAHVGPTEPQPNLRDISTVLQPGLDGNHDKGWVVPGWPAWISREGRSISPSGRLMYFSTGRLFPITDSSGFGRFLRVIVVDTRAKRTIFRKQYHSDSDVTLSPDGKWFAVREQTRLTLRKL